MEEQVIKTEETKTSTPETDISKIKIRHILAQRIKDCKFKKCIAIILLAVVCFCGGILTDRFVIRHDAGRGYYGNYGTQRRIPGNFNSQFKNRSQSNQSNKNQSQNTPQGPQTSQ